MPAFNLDSLHLDKGNHTTREQGVCLMEGRRRPNGTLGTVAIEERLWPRAVVTAFDCWEFQGTRTKQGYGNIRHEGRMRKAHRVAYELTRGPIPTGQIVMHLCDNPPCINPVHLCLGTVADNNRDRHAKGRTVRPENGPDYQRRKTHCPKGHPYSGENVRYRANGARRCATCYREASRRRRAERTAG